MATVSNFAARMHEETGYTARDISLTRLEYLIDNAIDYVNLEAGTSIASLDGTAKAKSFTGSADETVAVKAASNLLMRGYKEKGPNLAAGGLNVVQVVNDPHFKIESMILRAAINKLRTRSFVRT